jgi:hypothetical protein
LLAGSPGTDNQKRAAMTEPDSTIPTCDSYVAGATAARYMPADPAAWFEAASAAGYHTWVQGDLLAFQIDGVPADVVHFFNGWLHRTHGADRVLYKYLRVRGIGNRPGA